MRLTCSRNSAGNWPSVTRASRATTSVCSVRRLPSVSIAPSSARSAATPPPAVTCKPTVLSPMASASTPPDLSAAGGLQRGNAQRKTGRLQFRRRQNLFQRRDVRVREWPPSRTSFLAAGQRAARVADLQRRRVGVKPFLGFQLQQARGVGLRQRRQFGLRRQHPFQRQADDAVALAHAGGVELVADFAARRVPARR